MTTWTIQNKTVEYDDETHTYLVNGIIVPTVTTIVKAFFNDYTQIPQSILDRAAQRGTELHEAIERYEKTGETSELIEFKNYLFLKERLGIVNRLNEVPVIYCKNDRPLFAGRIDQIMTINDKLYINDFKRVSAPNKDKITAQLNLYKIAYEQSYNVIINCLSFTQLREEKRKLYLVSIKERETMELINLYFKEI